MKAWINGKPDPYLIISVLKELLNANGTFKANGVNII